MKQLVISIALCSLAFGAVAQTMWRDAPMLASPAQISALMPQAQPTSQQQRAADPSALLEIPSTSIAGEAFSATYHFEADQLQRIYLAATPPTRERTQALLKTLQASLRKNYGLPVSTKIRPAAALGAVDMLWDYRRMTVQLLTLQGNGVALIYSVSQPRQAEGL